jgi:hypothetical protein
MLVTAILAILSISPPQGWTESRFQQLSVARNTSSWPEASNKLKGFDGYTVQWQETLGGAGALALYPVGEGDRRYLLYYSEGDSGALLYEVKAGRNVKLVWFINLRSDEMWVDRKSVPGSVKGTLRRYLTYRGWRIVRPSRLTKAQRVALSFEKPFASVFPTGRDPEHTPRGSFITADGNPGSREGTAEEYEVTPEEKAYLRSRDGG